MNAVIKAVTTEVNSVIKVIFYKINCVINHFCVIKKLYITIACEIIIVSETLGNVWMVFMIRVNVFSLRKMEKISF